MIIVSFEKQCQRRNFLFFVVVGKRKRDNNLLFSAHTLRSNDSLKSRFKVLTPHQQTVWNSDNSKVKNYNYAVITAWLEHVYFIRIVQILQKNWHQGLACVHGKWLILHTPEKSINLFIRNSASIMFILLSFEWYFKKKKN